MVAAFASWHEWHSAADRALSAGALLVSHSALEVYSVLTRLPAPHRAPGHVVRDFLAARFPDAYLSLPPSKQRELVARLVGLGISGGATYDGLIASTAAHAGAVLLTCDLRAVTTYERCGVRYRLLEGVH